MMSATMTSTTGDMQANQSEAELEPKWLRDISDQTPATVVDGSEFYAQATRGQSQEPQPPSPRPMAGDRTYDHTGIADLMPNGCQEEEKITPWPPQRLYDPVAPARNLPIDKLHKGENRKQVRHDRTHGTVNLTSKAK